MVLEKLAEFGPSIAAVRRLMPACLEIDQEGLGPTLSGVYYNSPCGTLDQ
jgi:hypothetical protein